MTSDHLATINPKGRSPLASYVQSYLYYKAGLSPRTLEQYRDMLTHLVWWLDHFIAYDVALADVRPIHIMRFYEYLRAHHPEGRWGSGKPNTHQPASKKTIKLHEVTFKTFFTWAVERRYIKRSPFQSGDVPSQPSPEPNVEPLSNDEIAALLAACNPHAHSGTRNRALILLLLSTGLRISELCAVKLADYNIATGEIIIRHGKGDKQRTVYAGRPARAALWDYIGGRDRQSTDWLFISERTGGPLDRNAVSHILTRLEQKAGVSEARAHRLRHSYATGALRKGMSEQALIRLLGHASEKMLRIYVNLSQVDLQQMARDYDPSEDVVQQPKRKRR
jgi:site-specific recombinase XerD